MLKDGTYAAWYKTAIGEGTSFVQLSGGKILGRDSILTYAGYYQTNGEHFSAVLQTKRHSAGQPSVFGVDNLTLRLSGTCKETLATCTGWADQAPGIRFEATLMYSRPEDPPPARHVTDFHPERLPPPPSR